MSVSFTDKHYLLQIELWMLRIYNYTFHIELFCLTSRVLEADMSAAFFSYFLKLTLK